MGASPIQELSLYHMDTTAAPRTGSPATSMDPAAGGKFSAQRYSRFKYGCPHSTSWFARHLVALLISRSPAVLDTARVLFASSPYHQVPTAAHALTVHMRALLNSARAARGLPAAPLLHIDRQVVTSGDYGRLPAAERTNLMAANRLSLHRIPRAVLPGAHLVVIDDIKVTGAHQHCLAMATDTLPVAARTFAQIAELADRPGAVDPTVEDRLNHAQITTLADLAPIATAPGFAWNVRVCKFLLSPANRTALPAFLRGMPREFVHDLHAHTVRDGYHTMELYQPSHSLVTDELHRRATGVRA